MQRLGLGAGCGTGLLGVGEGVGGVVPKVFWRVELLKTVVVFGGGVGGLSWRTELLETVLVLGGGVAGLACSTGLLKTAPHVLAEAGGTEEDRAAGLDPGEDMLCRLIPLSKSVCWLVAVG